MLEQIKGLHHVTSMASDARRNNAFFTGTLGLRRVKKTVNFDAPDVYHLYYADELGTPGSVMTYFPFPHIAKGRPGVGEVGTTVFSVPEGSLPYWSKRLSDAKASTGLKPSASFGENRLDFRRAGPRRLCAGRGKGRQPRALGEGWRARPTRRSAASIPRRSGCATPVPPRNC